VRLVASWDRHLVRGGASLLRFLCCHCTVAQKTIKAALEDTLLWPNRLVFPWCPDTTPRECQGSAQHNTTVLFWRCSYDCRACGGRCFGIAVHNSKE